MFWNAGVGIVQAMLAGRRVQTVMANVDMTISTCVQDGNLDLFFMCEVGGHLEGFHNAQIDPTDLPVLAHGPQFNPHITFLRGRAPPRGSQK